MKFIDQVVGLSKRVLQVILDCIRTLELYRFQ